MASFIESAASGGPPSSEMSDETIRKRAIDDGKKLLEDWTTIRGADISKVKERVKQLIDSNTISATTFNDLYKWTMLPVIRKMETYKTGDINVTFGIDLRDESMRQDMRTDPTLCAKIHEALMTMTTRKFDRTIFKSILEAPRSSILTENDITAVCGTTESPNSLVNIVKPFNEKFIESDYTSSDVTICFYYDEDKTDKDGTKGVHFIEATGPWHRVTWLETTMMQCVYEAKLQYDLEKLNISHDDWINQALLRCAQSVAYTRIVQKEYKMPTPALFAGRRTGGLAFIVLQNLFFADHFNQLGPLYNGAIKSEYKKDDTGFAKTNCLGTSSCDSWYILKSLELPCLNPAGTHAHELSMVSSVLFPQIDQNDQKLPLTQIIGHYLYLKLTWEKTAGLMPMLPDTLGTCAFMKAAKYVKYNNEPFIKAITSARQDSGTLVDFNNNMIDFGYAGAKMASEIDTTDKLLEAAKLGYQTFGAGGFFGDSEKVWEASPKISSNSMAVKAVRVRYDNSTGLPIDKIPYMKKDGETFVIGYPIKTGDPSNISNLELSNDKLSLDKNLDEPTFNAIKEYASDVRKTAITNTVVNGSINIDDLIDITAGVKSLTSSADTPPPPPPPKGGRRTRKHVRKNTKRNKKQNKKRSHKRK